MLGITAGEWERFIIHVTGTLQNQAIPEREANEFLAAADSLRAEIVETSPRIAIAPSAREAAC